MWHRFRPGVRQKQQLSIDRALLSLALVPFPLRFIRNLSTIALLNPIFDPSTCLETFPVFRPSRARFLLLRLYLAALTFHKPFSRHTKHAR